MEEATWGLQRDPHFAPVVLNPLPPPSPLSTGKENMQRYGMFSHLQTHTLRKTLQNFTKLFPFCPKKAAAVPMGEVGRTAGDVVAMKSAICRRAHMWDELFPFFICSWMRLSSSSLKDCGTPAPPVSSPSPQGCGDQAGSIRWHRGAGTTGSVVAASLAWWHQQRGGNHSTAWWQCHR